MLSRVNMTHANFCFSVGAFGECCGSAEAALCERETTARH